jgi:hypothetical protein
VADGFVGDCWLLTVFNVTLNMPFGLHFLARAVTEGTCARELTVSGSF